MFENWMKIIFAFQEDTAINEIYDVSKSMMKKSLISFENSVFTLRSPETVSKDFDVYSLDKEINQFERDIRRKLFFYQNSDIPTKNHRAILVMSLIAHDIERIGDYSKNIYELAGNHDTPVSFGKYNETLKIIENLILSEFKKSISYFVEFNEKIHQSIGEGLTKANEVIEKSLNEIQQNPDCVGSEQKEVISLVLYLRFLKRTSSHLRNISTSYYNPIDRIGFSLEK